MAILRPSDHVTALGDFIKRQRERQELTLRQLADRAGISNPYLSQIEHGLREPSERVLEALASNLQVSADVLYERAGKARGEEHGSAVLAAIAADERLTRDQRQALIEIYESFTGGGEPARDT